MSQETIKNKTERNYGIDLLRNISMLLVVILHVLGVGGILAATSDVFVKTTTLKMLHIAAMCAVNCYGLISGYVGYQSKFRLSNILLLWVQVFLYSVGIGLLFYVIRPDLVSIVDVKCSVLPVLFGQYWYFTAYFALFFTMPILNAAIQNIPRRLLEISFGTLLCLLTFGQQTLFVNDVFGTEGGYSYLWLVVLYCIGGYIRKYQLRFKKPLIVLLLYAGCILACVVARFLMSQLGAESVERLEAYNSPVMVFMAIVLVVFFANMKLSNWIEKLSSFFAPVSFGVFLINTHPVVFRKILKGAFAWVASCPVWSLIPLTVVVAVGVYIVCAGVDLIRHYIFKAIKLKTLLSKLDEKILPDGGNT